MASLFIEKGIYTVAFRLGKSQYRRSLKTSEAKEANGRFKRIEVTLYDIEQGRLTIPEGADIGKFILSEGRLEQKLEVAEVKMLKDVIETYKQEKVGLAKTSMDTIVVHTNWLLSIIKNCPIASISSAQLKTYINTRCEVVKPRTVKKEIATLRAIWNWSKIKTEFPDGLEYPKEEQKPPFKTWTQIERIIMRGGLSAKQVDALWECLWLDGMQVKEVLEFVREHAPALYPRLCLIAYTGCRRSEMLRCQSEDYDWETNTVNIREKKHDKSKEFTIRHVRMPQKLVAVMKPYLANHRHVLAFPDWNSKVSNPYKQEIGKPNSSHQFNNAMAGSKWEVLRGYHVFRHSLASNFARSGVDQRIIDEILGHTTEEMRRRYRHLHPDSKSSAMDKVFA